MRTITGCNSLRSPKISFASSRGKHQAAHVPPDDRKLNFPTQAGPVLGSSSLQPSAGLSRTQGQVIECDELFAAAHESVKLGHQHRLQKFGPSCREVLIVAVQDLPVE